MSTLVKDSEKWKLIKQMSNGVNVMIETGTLRGDTIEAMLNNFREIHSIEIDDKLYRKAVTRFKDFPNVHLYHGNSALILPNMLKNIDERCLFWLDAHKTNTSPILGELNAINNHHIDGHIILIDDWSYFYGTMKNVNADDIYKRLNGYNIKLHKDKDILVALK